ncbi:DM2 domain-containing protein [Plasmodiophora brassicae]|uniref:DM2 domain-containing protein n=1 Tax=Plasmodiophora brassicae TaxID=37360 RepID=A0A0G4J354_PLABS|nr:hypothetical protein PBRA_008721 [Plasmodiophora brassicae]SPQ98403.1 unnamed protein product [Plasmodiophora brassicae]
MFRLVRSMLPAAKTGFSMAAFARSAGPKSRKTFLNTRTHKLSPELSAVCGGKKSLTRTAVTKQVWGYIKKNDLQKSSDKRVVVCDAKLKKVMGGKEIGMFRIGKAIQPHILGAVKSSKKM